MSDDYSKLEQVGISANELSLFALQGISFQIFEHLARLGKKGLYSTKVLELQRKRDALIQFLRENRG